MFEFSSFWSIDLDSDKASRVYLFENFGDAFMFVSRIAMICERRKHHADISIIYNRVELTLRTHDCNTLTEQDFLLAKAIDACSTKLNPIYREES